MSDLMGKPFAVVWNDGSVSAKSVAWVSSAYDLADVDATERVRDILATDDTGKLVPIRIGPREWYAGMPGEELFVYASAPIYAGSRLMGHIEYTDH